MAKVSDLFRLRIQPQFSKGGSMVVDWSNPSCKISKYFTVKEACWLNASHIMYYPSTEEQSNIIKTAEILDKIRDFLKHPIIVVSWIRPSSYNQMIGGAPKSEHINGNAVDFTTGQDCDMIRKILFPLLPYWDIRMEDLPGSKWVHVDRKHVVDKYKFFKP